MNWKQFFSSPPPSTGWVLDAEAVVGMRRDTKGALHCTAASVPAKLFEVGPVGLSSVDAEALGELLAPLKTGLAAARRAAVIIPTAWVRSYLLDFEKIPRRRAEVDDVLRWRMKKLLPMPPSEMRIAWTPTTSAEGTRRLLVMVGFERAMSALEKGLADAGIEPGLLSSRLFALIHGCDKSSAARVVVQAEAGFLSSILVRGGAVELVRTKPVPDDLGSWEGASSETRLILDYIRNALEIVEPFEVEIVADSSAADARLREEWGRHEDLSVLPAPATQPCSEPGLAERLGGARLAPLRCVLLGGGR